MTVTVANALAVSITAPANNGTVSGTIAVNATATGPVVGVQFRLDGANLGNEDTTSPYGSTWNTTTASAGSHTLTAVARNAQGGTVTSTPVTVTVNNSTPTLLVGSQTLLTGLDSNTPAKAEAFRTTATASGGLTRLTIYIDTGNTASHARRRHLHGREQQAGHAARAGHADRGHDGRVEHGHDPVGHADQRRELLDRDPGADRHDPLPRPGRHRRHDAAVRDERADHADDAAGHLDDGRPLQRRPAGGVRHHVRPSDRLRG